MPPRNPPTNANANVSPPATLQRLGKYRIQKKLGAGGMGTVYLAVDEELQRPVALKVLSRERAENPILVKRFKAEGQAAAALSHPNIVSVYGAGEDGGHLYLALEFVDGIDVHTWLCRRGVIPPRRSLKVIRQATAALQHAFERNFVHRDIKPSNLLIARDGAVKLADMGLARSIDESLDTKITRDGTTVGTVDYMAPEQAANSRAADIRSDIYSLGCTWHHMLTGSCPYPEGSVTNKLTAHLSAPLPDPRETNPQVPAAMVAVIHRMMAKLPEQRYQTPAELLRDLDQPSLDREGDAVDLDALFQDDDFPEPLPAPSVSGMTVVDAAPDPAAGRPRKSRAPLRRGDFRSTPGAMSHSQLPQWNDSAPISAQSPENAQPPLENPLTLSPAQRRGIFLAAAVLLAILIFVWLR